MKNKRKSESFYDYIQRVDNCVESLELLNDDLMDRIHEFEIGPLVLFNKDFLDRYISTMILQTQSTRELLGKLKSIKTSLFWAQVLLTAVSTVLGFVLVFMSNKCVLL